jgi:predicted Rossmann fold flavoprotein
VKIAVIGAGAAGCFAAANIPAGVAEVTLFEKTGKALQKVKASGGGRCNVTHACFDIPQLIHYYPRGKHLLRKTLPQFSPQDTIEWFAQRGVALKTEADGRVFPKTDSSQTIIDCIWEELMKHRVQVHFHKSVDSISKEGERFLISFSDESTFVADRVLVATGGFPKAEQYHWIEELGHGIETPVPSLFTFNMPGNPVTQLMGISVQNATVKILQPKIETHGPLLITHWGMSGPAVLKASAVGARWLHDNQYRFDVMIRWIDGYTHDQLHDFFQTQRKEKGSAFLNGKNPLGLPQRLWEFLLTKSGVAATIRYADLTAGQQYKLADCLLRDIYSVSGKTTFKEEFVTCGGVKLQEIDAQSLESKIVKGLFFAGEILDVDGVTGGFNFQHAWSSGWIAAQHLAQ